MDDDTKPILLSENFEFTEGPTADNEGNIYFTDQPNNQILKWIAKTGEIEVFMQPAGRANGLDFDLKGNLIAAADENFQLWSIDQNKEYKILVNDFNGKKLNGPNDVWVDGKGGMYFTDPYYQRNYWERKKPDLDQEMVYYLDPKGSISIAVSDLVKPNGIIGSIKNKLLYIADIEDKKTYSFHISEDGSLTNKKLFTEMGSDGMTMDSKGNIYLTGRGVTIFNKEGIKIKHINIDRNWTSNLTFGGENNDILFITATDAVYKLQMNVKGVNK